MKIANTLQITNFRFAKQQGNVLQLLLNLWQGKHRQLIPIPIPVKQKGNVRCLLLLIVASVAVNTNSYAGNESKHPQAKVRHQSKPISVTDLPGENLISNLYAIVNNANSLADGNLVMFDDTYSNGVDGNDVRKLSNFGENFGLSRNGVVLVVEKRKLLTGNDTIFFDMTNLNQISYQLEVVALRLNHPNMIGTLEDNFLNSRSRISLEDTTRINFAVTSNPASSARNRFRIVFSSFAAGPLPISFTSISAIQNGRAVDLNWRVTSQINVKEYIVEKSIDGLSFTSLGIKAAVPALEISVNYFWQDANPESGLSFYRVTSVDNNGVKTFSPVVKLITAKTKASIKVFPNPIVGNNFQIHFAKQPQGIYQLRLINLYGQTIFTKTISHDDGNAVYIVATGSALPKGLYQLAVINDQEDRWVQKLLVQ